jgi:hypothetical protein
MERNTIGLLPEQELGYGSFVTSVVVNFAILALVLIIGLTAKHVIERPRSEQVVVLGLSTTRPAPKAKLPEVPTLGESLLKDDGTPWMGNLVPSAVKLNWDDLSQIAALPLGSWLKTDPWHDKVHMLNAKRYAPMNDREKMPLKVTLLFYKLQRHNDSMVSP